MSPIDGKHQPRPFPPPPQQDRVRFVKSKLKAQGLNAYHRRMPQLSSPGL